MVTATDCPTERDDADCSDSERLLLLRCDLIAVPAGAKLDEFLLANQVNEPARPWVMYPHAVVVRGAPTEMCSGARLEFCRFEASLRVPDGDE